uniref:Multiple EGF like domains 10 n=1 Tax=Myotis myotis TaxID=51298 RepID=A0A7J7Y119_MYOMY|nr:multiple EGF like domains 10 [Myotis myotis]
MAAVLAALLSELFLSLTSLMLQIRPAMAITGGRTAAAGASAKTGPCATPSPGPATAPRASGAGAARSAVSRAPTGTTVTSDASARTEPPATTPQESAAAHPGTPEPSVRIFVPLASMVHSVSRGAPARMEECVITSLGNAPVLLAGWAQCVVSLAPRVALERTVHKNVSAIMEGRVMPPQDNVIAVQDTRGNGARTSALWADTECTVRRPASVSTGGNATT